MLREELGLSVHQLGGEVFKGGGNPGMELPPRTAQQSAVSSLLDKRVLEQVLRGGRRATLKDQAGIDEALERFLEPFFSEFTDRSCQLVGKFAADRGADLGNTGRGEISFSTTPIQAT
jgi:hypothetical protein